MHLTSHPWPAPGASHSAAQDPLQMPEAWVRQGQFLRMCQSFNAYGGLGRHAEPPRPPTEGPPPLAFRWTGVWWVPGFQFDPTTQEVHAKLAALYADLPEARDAWNIACWLATPHPTLGGYPPVALLPGHIATVREAARIERFFING